MAFAYPGLPYPGIDPHLMLLRSLVHTRQAAQGQNAVPGGLVMGQLRGDIGGFDPLSQLRGDIGEFDPLAALHSLQGMAPAGPDGSPYSGAGHPPNTGFHHFGGPPAHPDPSQDPNGALRHDYQSHIADSHELAKALAASISRVRAAGSKRPRLRPNGVGRRLPPDPEHLTFHHAPVNSYPSGPRGQQ